MPYRTREELNDPKCAWEFHLRAHVDNHAFATLLVPLPQPFTGGDLTVFPFDPLDELSDDDADFKTNFIPLHPTDGGSPVYAASFNAPNRITLKPVKSGARNSSDDSAYEYSSGELSELELGYEEECATFLFDVVDANGKKEDYCYLEGEYYSEDVFLNVESVDDIALRFHSKSADERPVFDDPNDW